MQILTSKLFRVLEHSFYSDPSVRQKHHTMTQMLQTNGFCGKMWGETGHYCGQLLHHEGDHVCCRSQSCSFPESGKTQPARTPITMEDIPTPQLLRY